MIQFRITHGNLSLTIGTWRKHINYILGAVIRRHLSRSVMSICPMDSHILTYLESTLSINVYMYEGHSESSWTALKYRIPVYDTFMQLGK